MCISISNYYTNNNFDVSIQVWNSKIPSWIKSLRGMQIIIKKNIQTIICVKNFIRKKKTINKLKEKIK